MDKDERKRAMERRLAALKADPDDKRHGTITAYRYGCRCPKCLEAQMLYYMGKGGRSKIAERRHAKKLEQACGMASLSDLVDSARPAVVDVHGVGKVRI